MEKLMNLLEVTQRPVQAWGCEAELPRRLMEKIQPGENSIQWKFDVPLK